MQKIKNNIWKIMVCATIIALAGCVFYQIWVNQNETTSDTQKEKISQDFPPDAYYRGKITDIKEKNETLSQATVILRNGEEKNIDINKTLADNNTLRKQMPVVVVKSTALNETSWYVVDTDRTVNLLLLVILFSGLVIILGKWKGAGSLAGLCISIIIVTQFTVPQIAEGKNPLLITLATTITITVISMYLAHGFNKETSISVVSTTITLTLAAMLAQLAIGTTKLSGIGSEETFILQQLQLENINFNGLLLSGILISTLGILDDVTTGQTAIIKELIETDSNLSKKQLWEKALTVGREHIASLVNTLFLVYAGAALPLFLILKLENQPPLWAILNSEIFAQEIVRTIIGSSALILAIPIATGLAIFVLKKK